MDNQDNKTINTYDDIKEIEDKWETFPWKIDYILYILFSQKEIPADIILQLEHGESVDICVSVNGQLSQLDLDYLPLNKTELFNYFNIPINGYNDFVQFIYHSEIFENMLNFRGQKSLFGKENTIMLCYLGNQQRVNVHDFNDKYKKYLMFYDLNETIPSKNSTTMRTKI